MYHSFMSKNGITIKYDVCFKKIDLHKESLNIIFIIFWAILANYCDIITELTLHGKQILVFGSLAI